MKGPARRLVDHKGRPWPLWLRRRRDPSAAADPRDKQNNVSFFGLWRYATWAERLATLLGVALSCASALCTLTAVSLYGELTALFVARHTARESGERAPILALFGGGRQLGAGDRPRHMDALVEDCVAFAWASAATMGAQVLVAAAAVTAANWAADNMTRRVRLRLLAAALAQEAAFYDTHSDLDYATVLSQDTEALRDGTGEHVVMTSYLCSYVLMAAAVSLWHGWLLTLVALAVVPVAVISAAIVAKIGSACASREAAAYACAGRGAQEALANVATVRAYAGEHVEVHRFDAALRPVSAAARRRFGAGAAGAALGWLSTYSMSALVLAVGASLCVRDMHLPPHQQEYHPGALVIILFSTFMCCQNITLVQPHVEVISLARGSARALQRLLGRAPAIDAAAPGVRPAGGAFRGEIAFRDVFFNYPARPDVKVLRGLTLAVAAGETVALVGASGCGKSTLLQLLQRAYEPDAGGVSVDGVPLHQLDLHHFRTSIGVVGQEPVLFSGTLRENIALGTEASLEDVIVAAKAAHAHQFIAKLPDGYETLVGERGAALSGGQKQRVAIARALLRKPAILLLDEPTSALDPVAERQVQAALDAASAGRTTLVVSHRLSTIVNASRIVYLEQGAVREQGTHQELMALRGAYFRLATAGDAAADAASPASPAAAAVSEPSAPSLPAGVGADDDDVAAALDTVSDPPPLQRSFERRSTRASLASESGIRSSWRLGAPLAAPPAEPAPSPEPKSCECKESSSEEEVPPASGLALLRLSAREWPQLLGGGLAALLVGAAMPAFAFLFSRIFGMFALSSGEEILQSSRLHAGLFALFALLCALSAAAQGWLLGLAGAKLTHRLRVLLLANYLRQEQAWFERPSNSVGALCARLAGDCAAVHGATGARLGTMLQGASTLLLGVALALPYSWSMTLVSLLSVPCVIGAIYAEGAVSRRSTAARRRALEQAAKVANEGISNVRTVHSLGVESMIVGRYRAALCSGAALTRRAQLARGVAYGLCVSAPTLGYTVSLAYGGWLVARRGLQYDHAILVCEALIYGAWMLAEALSFAPSFAAAKRAGARILHALQRQPTVATEPTARDDPQWRASGELTLSDVRFSYGGSPVLRGLSLRLAAGGSVALVGRSGCGKSTVLRLLLRAYDPDGGTLSMDGRDIRRDVPLPQLRAQLALVQQEPALFERSIRENIAYGDNSRLVPLEEVIDAATQANVHAFIASLPMGYDTVLSGGGSALSGGQKQRVAIARALLRKPRVLLLDEATSALDAASEKSVSEALRAAGQGRSTVAVAHRLATVAHVDTIALINNGVVEESGSHQELLALRGHYWRLWTEQGSH